MNAEKLANVVELYRLHLEGMGLQGEEFDEAAYNSLKTGMHLLDHCLWMTRKMAEEDKEPDIMEELRNILPQETFGRLAEFTKKNRWLGFLQGCFAMGQIFSIQEMRDHSRSS